MGWVKLDDQFADHPKVAKAGPLASWLFVCGLTYCNRLLTDGFIPSGQVGKLAAVQGALKLAARLVDAGMWEEVEGGYRVHDYLDYQPSREKAQAISEKRASAGRAGGKQKASNVLATTVAKSYPVPDPVPVPQEQQDSHPVAGDAPPPPGDAWPLVDGLIEALTTAGRVAEHWDPSAHWRRAQMAFAVELAANGVQPADVAGCVDWLVRDPYWASRTIDLRVVRAKVDEFLSNLETAEEPATTGAEAWARRNGLKSA